MMASRQITVDPAQPGQRRRRRRHEVLVELGSAGRAAVQRSHDVGVTPAAGSSHVLALRPRVLAAVRGDCSESSTCCQAAVDVDLAELAAAPVVRRRPGPAAVLLSPASSSQRGGRLLLVDVQPVGRLGGQRSSR